MKFCPRCGNRVDSSEKFCPKCGYRLKGNQSQSGSGATQRINQLSRRTVRPQNPQPNYSQNWQQADQAMGKAKNYSVNYFNWLVDTLKNPLDVKNNVHPYFGITSFGIGAVLLILSIHNIVNTVIAAFDSFMDRFGELGDSVAGNANVSNIKSNSITTAIVLCLLGYVIYWLVGFLASKITLGDQNALKYGNQLATYTNSALVLEALIFILTLVNSYGLASLLFLLTTVIYNVGLIYSVVKGSRKPIKLYVAVVASCCVPIFILILISFIASFEL